MPTDYDLDQISPVSSVADTDKLYLVTAAGLDGRATAAQLRATTSSKISDFSTSVDARITAVKGVANGLCALDGSSKVPNANLTSTGANSVVLRDGNQNISVNSVIEGFRTTVASATALTLVVGSEPNHYVIGSGGQTIKLPDATTLSNGANYCFNNNQSSGAISVNNNSNTLVASIPSGGFSTIILLDNSTAAGVWERHEMAPSNVSWSTNTLDYAGSITNATWNGVAVALSRGGTGATTQQAAINALAGGVTSGQFLRGNGTNVVMSAIQASDVPTLNQSTTGTAANITGTAAIANGGTGATTQQAALNALAGATTSAQFLRGNGTNVLMSAIQASDVPTLNQNTTGTAANVTGTVGIANGGTGATTRQDAMDALAGATTSGQYLRGNGVDVVMSAIQAADVPTLNQNTTGTAANVTGIVAVGNGGTGATTASAARTALSAASSGANTDITSVALTTGTVSATPSGSNDIVNKAYADAIGSGVNFHDACNYATIAELSPSATYAQPGGATVGVGATLTGSTNAALQVDGVTVSVGQRILVKNQTAGTQNGVYTVTRQGDGATVPYILTRASDYDTNGTGTNEVQAGDFILILSGTLSNTAWVQQTAGAITFGTTALSFTQFAAAAAVAGVSSFSGGSTGLTPNTASTGAVALAGTLAITNGGTGQTTTQTAQIAMGGMVLMDWNQTSAVTGTYSTATNTLTYGSNGILTVDGGNPAVGDLVLLSGNFSANTPNNIANGPYVVTDVGSASTPAVLTRPSWFTGTLLLSPYFATKFGSGQTGVVRTFVGPATSTKTGFTVGTSLLTPISVSARTSNLVTAGGTMTGKLVLNGNTTTTAAMAFQAGVLLTTPVAHSIEWDGAAMYLTNSSAVRDKVLTENSFGTY